MGKNTEVLTNIYLAILGLFKRFVDLLADLFNISHFFAKYMAYGMVGLLGVIIVLIFIYLLVRKINKKKNDVKKQDKQMEIPDIKKTTAQIKKEIVVEKVKIISLDKDNGKRTFLEQPQKKFILKEEDDGMAENKTSRVALGKFEVFPVNDVFLYRLKASNGEILVVSEIYTTLKGAVSAVETVKKNVETGTIQVYQDKHGLWQFKLFASNKRQLVVSANYPSQAGCESAANSFKRFAVVSPVVVLQDDPEHLMEEIKMLATADKKGGKLHIIEENGDYNFQLLASNGVMLCTSPDFSNKNAVINAISVIKEAVKSGRFFVVKDKRETFQFKLYSSLGRCVLVGEAYKGKAQAISSANSVASFINLAEIIDKTIQ